MLFLFNVVAVARKERDALVGHGLVVVLAVLAAVFLAIGIVMRQRATMDVPQEHGVSSVMFLTLLRRPLWWAGTAAAVAGYVFQALALAKGSLLLVQPILVSALLFALPLSARLAHRRMDLGGGADHRPGGVRRVGAHHSGRLRGLATDVGTRRGDLHGCGVRVRRRRDSHHGMEAGGFACARGGRAVRCRRGADQAGDARAHS